MDCVGALVFGVGQIPSPGWYVNVLPLSVHEFAHSATRSQYEPDGDFTAYAHVRTWKLSSQSGHRSGRQDPFALSLCATRLALCNRIQRIALYDFTRERKVEHLLQVSQQNVTGSQLAFCLDGIKDGKQVRFANINGSHIAERRKYSPFKLFTAILAAVLTTTALAICPQVWRQFGRGPTVEDLTNRYAALLV